MQQHRKRVIIIAGPTAAGKTAFAIEVAKALATSIISADSRQCYRELNIGVARPSVAQLQAIPHYFIASHSIHDNVNAAVFEQYALATASQLFQSSENVVMTGGTGLYIDAFCNGLDEIPSIDPAIRQSIIDDYSRNGMQWLQEQVQQDDPVFWEQGERQNPQRMMRALEVVRSTGRSIISYRDKAPAARDFEVVKYCLSPERATLYERINNRVHQMLEEGLFDEVKSLFPQRHLNALQTVGYAELFDHIEGKISLEQATALIQQHTRHYAKRQLTWFRKDPAYTWIGPETDAQSFANKLVG